MTDNQALVGGMQIDDFGYRGDWQTHERPSTAVVVAVADAIGVQQTELPVLNDTVDGDALDMLLEHTDEPVDVTFEYADATVYISSTGTLAVKR